MRVGEMADAEPGRETLRATDKGRDQVGDERRHYIMQDRQREKRLLQCSRRSKHFVPVIGILFSFNTIHILKIYYSPLAGLAGYAAAPGLQHNR